MHRRTLPALALIGILCACSRKESTNAPLPPFSDVRANLAFTCAYEADRLPPIDPQADQFFKYARYLQTKKGPKDFDDIARYYRIAAAYGHYKANHNLQQLVATGFASSPYPERESIELATQLINQGVPMGYYDIGYYLNLGYGLKQNKEMALRYFRKAADLGNPDAQFYVADQLAPQDLAPDIAKQMRQCAMNQGYGRAANILGIDLKTDKFYPEAIEAFQKGVMAGDSSSASFLEAGFKAPPPSDDLYYLALQNDPERAQRHRKIWAFLTSNDGRNPKVPDIDQIVPLPPAKLPEWDGTFQWQKEQDAAPFAKPSDDLIERMSKAKNLDPATGLPIPPPPKTALGTRIKTGERCPENGHWCVGLASGYRIPNHQRFKKGDVLPTYAKWVPRRFEILDDLFGMRYEDIAVEWELVRYADKA